MRPTIVVLLGAWVAGIIIGVATTGSHVSLLGAVGCLLVVRACTHSGPLITAATAVFLLGAIYGDVARPAGSLVCQPESTIVGEISVRADIRENSVRYLMVDHNNCRWFVYSERWPVLPRGSVAEVVGGRFSDQASILREQPSYGRFLVQHQVSGVWSYPTVTPVTIADTDQHYRALLARTHRVFSEPDASVVGAILLADRGQFPEELNEYFRRTSLTHILSISGTHISLLTGMIFAVVSLVPLSPTIRTIVVISLVWAYVWFVGAPVSAMRAGVFWSVALTGLRLGLLVSLPTAVVLTLVFMLTWQPLLVLDIGLQLSFLAVVGLGLALFIAKPWRNRGPTWLRPLMVAAIVSLGATLFTWPLISYYFGLVSLSAVVANLFILPSVPIIMAGSIVAIAVSYLSSLASYLVALPVHAAIAWMIAVARVLGTWSGLWLEVTVPAWFIAAYYGGLLVALLVVVRWQKRSWREIWE